MCQECVEISKMDIPASWYRVDGAIKSNAPDHIKLSNFLKRILPITGDRYCFIKNTNIKSREKLEVICAVHGSFMMTSAHLLDGKNCPKCSGKYRYNTEEFITECKSRYGDSFDYSNTVYTTAHSYIDVKCNICDSTLKVKAYNHLQKGSCLTCSGLRKKTTEEFITEAKAVHGDNYSYDHVDYINTNTKVKIQCNTCDNIVEQTPINHLAGLSPCSCYTNKNLENTLVYLLKGNDNIYKIGITVNITTRLRELNSSKDMDFRCILQSPILGFQKAHKLEQLLHKHFRDKQCKDFLETDLNGKTELFNLNEEDLQYIDTYIKEYCKKNNLILG